MSLTILLYGSPGSGKTPTLFTAPGPTLFLAAETGFRFIKSRPIVNWAGGRCPEVAEDDVVIRRVTTWQDFSDALELLKSGRHPFKSVCLDTLTALQSHIVSEFGGNMNQQRWGDVLTRITGSLTILTELAQPGGQLQVVAITAQQTLRDGEAEITPLVSGAVRDRLPEFFDVVMYTGVRSGYEGTHPLPSDTRAIITPGNGVQARDRTTEHPSGGLSARLNSDGRLEGPFNLSEFNDILQ